MSVNLKFTDEERSFFIVRSLDTLFKVNNTTYSIQIIHALLHTRNSNNDVYYIAWTGWEGE